MIQINMASQSHIFSLFLYVGGDVWHPGACAPGFKCILTSFETFKNPDKKTSHLHLDILHAHEIVSRKNKVLCRV